MINKPMMGVAAAVVVIAAGTWYYLHNRHVETPHVTAPPPPAAPDESAIEHPVPAGAETAAGGPLPKLADSDAPLIDALAKIAGASAVKEYLLPDGIIRHWVVTIDNLPRQKVAVQKRPIAPVNGSFACKPNWPHA